MALTYMFLAAAAAAGLGAATASDVSRTFRPPLEAPFRVTSGYGPRLDPFTNRWSQHYGRDYDAPFGAQVRASATGVVTHAGPLGGYGLAVMIDHGGGVSTVYAHLSRVLVAPGAHAPQGDLIGEVGSTGRSTGPRLHFEVRRDGQATDPAAYLPVSDAKR